ncbi:hypothetical protein BV898_04196 [Hypsibius exemplaris]|uniref:Receptor ligand binding region domain-containing protein n=1 Tax=Hypsibius exemplaris TaxID=2072580 RepID=A0A1W0X3B7_HYPEX|nr:hypothetical protein BV898_04196 [Hypsibius exemplaris]
MTLGYVYNDSGASLAYLGPGLDVAVEEVQRTYHGVINFRHTYLIDRNILDCTALADSTEYMLSKWWYGPRLIANFTAFVGPQCLETREVNRLLSLWNVAFVTTISGDPILRDKTFSPTSLSTSSLTTISYAHLFQAILQRYNWRNIFAVFDIMSVISYQIYGSAILARLTRHAGFVMTQRKLDFRTKAQYLSALSDFKDVSRVCLFFGHAQRLRQFLVYASEEGMTNGEYVYLAMELNPSPLLGNLTWRYGDASDQPPTESVIGSVKIRKLEREFMRRTVEDFGLPIPKKPVNALLAANYAAVLIVAIVLNETLSRDSSFPFSNGREFARLFRDRGFHTDVADIYIDHVGERQPNLTVAQFDRDSGELTPRLLQLADLSRVLELSQLRWPSGNGAPPPNTPLCGYRNERSSCQGSATSWTQGFGVIGAFVSCLIGVRLVFLLKKRLFAKDRKASDFWLDATWLHSPPSGRCCFTSSLVRLCYY